MLGVRRYGMRVESNPSSLLVFGVRFGLALLRDLLLISPISISPISPLYLRCISRGLALLRDLLLELAQCARDGRERAWSGLGARG